MAVRKSYSSFGAASRAVKSQGLHMVAHEIINVGGSRYSPQFYVDLEEDRVDLIKRGFAVELCFHKSAGYVELLEKALLDITFYDPSWDVQNCYVSGTKFGGKHPVLVELHKRKGEGE